MTYNSMNYDIEPMNMINYWNEIEIDSHKRRLRSITMPNRQLILPSAEPNGQVILNYIQPRKSLKLLKKLSCSSLILICSLQIRTSPKVTHTYCEFVSPINVNFKNFSTPILQRQSGDLKLSNIYGEYMRNEYSGVMKVAR